MLPFSYAQFIQSPRTYRYLCALHLRWWILKHQPNNNNNIRHSEAWEHAELYHFRECFRLHKLQTAIKLNTHIHGEVVKYGFSTTVSTRWRSRWFENSNTNSYQVVLAEAYSKVYTIFDKVGSKLTPSGVKHKVSLKNLKIRAIWIRSWCADTIIVHSPIRISKMVWKNFVSFSNRIRRLHLIDKIQWRHRYWVILI